MIINANIKDFAPKQVKHIEWNAPCTREQVATILRNATIAANVNYEPQLTIEAQIVDWLYANNGTSLLLHGYTGRGKTFFAETIIPYMLKVLYNKSTHIYTAMGIQNDAALLRDAKSWAICSVDDVGMEVTSYFKDMAFLQMLDRVDREGKIVIATTNLNGDALKQMYGDRAYSRIICNFTRIKFDGNTDFRVKGREILQRNAKND